MNINNRTNYFIQQTYDQTLYTYIENREKNGSISLSSYYDLTFGKKENKLSIIANYFDYEPSTSVNFVTEYPTIIKKIA